MRNRKVLSWLVVGTILMEIGVALVIFNARPDAPLGFRLWFGSIGILTPVYIFWLFRRMIERKAD